MGTWLPALSPCHRALGPVDGGCTVIAPVALWTSVRRQGDETQVRTENGTMPAALSAAATVVDPAKDPHSLKVIVSTDGPVVVTGADLARAGWDPASTEVGAIALTSGGRTQAFELAGPIEGPLLADHRILFQGWAMTGPYTSSNVYWLVASGGGVVLPSRDVTQVPGMETAAWFSRTVHREEDTAYFVSMRASEGDDRWLWGEAIGPGKVREETFEVTGSRPEGPAPSLRIGLHGYTSDAAVDPDHHVRLRVNGFAAAEARFDGVGTAVIDADLPRSLLMDGENRLAIENVGDTGATVDLLALNWFEVTYSAGFTADGRRLDFQAPRSGRVAYTVRGFSESDVELFDVTEPGAPIRLTGASVQPGADGTYRLGFTDTTEEGTRYRAYTSAALAPPDRIEANPPSNWRDPANGADYIAITHPGFAAELQPLLAHRRSQGLRTALVSVDDVYDEFSHGVFDPRAIRAFLQHAYGSWQPPAPTYVLLVGEANLDYRGSYGTGPPNFVPSVQIDVEMSGDLGAVTSDLWFANLNGPDDDVIPEVLLGRFPVSTAAQAATVVSKTLTYELVLAEEDEAWRQAAVMVVDDDSATSFEAFSEQLIELMGPHARPRRFYAASYPRDRDLSGDLRAAIDEGARVVNFVGHGNVDLWGPWPGGGRIFQNADIQLLKNGSRLPILTSATCMNGWIDHPRKPVSMAELWLTKAGGGGVAAWSPSGYTMLSEQRRLMEVFYSGLYASGPVPEDRFGLENRSIGALAARAIVSAVGESRASHDSVRMFVLLGDPALVVAAPTAGPRASPTPSPTTAATPTASNTPAAPAYLPIAHRPPP